MKKTGFILLCFLFAFSSFSFGQLSERKWVVGSTLAIKKYDTGILKYDVDINIGYRLFKSFILGLRPEYHFENYRFNNLPDGSARTLSMAVYFRYYFLMGKKIQPIIDLNIGYLHKDYKNENHTSYYFNYYTNYGLGLNYFIRDWLALEAMYTFNTKFLNTLSGAFEIEDRDLRVGIQFFF